MSPGPSTPRIPILFAALVSLHALSCGGKERADPAPATSTAAEEPDDGSVWVRLEATEEDNGAGSMLVICSRTVLCSGLHLAPHRPATKFTVIGPGGAVVEINGAPVTLPQGRETQAKIDVTFDFGALPLDKLKDSSVATPTLPVRVKVKRRNGAEQEETLALEIFAAELHQIMKASGKRPTVFSGDRPEPAKPPVIYSEPGLELLGEARLVRDVDIVACWEPSGDRRPGQSCGMYKTGVMGPTVMVDQLLQDYQLRVVERRSGKVLLERLLVAPDGPCPPNMLAKEGEPYISKPGSYDVKQLLEPLRK